MSWSRGLKHNYLPINTKGDTDVFFDDDVYDGRDVTAPGEDLTERFFPKELVMETKQQWNKRTRIFAVVVGVVITALIIAAIVLVVSESNSPSSAARRRDGPPSVDMADVLDGWYSSKTFNGSWVSDTEILYRGESVGHVLLYDVISRKSRTLVEDNNLVPVSTAEINLSADRKFLMVAHSYQKLFRHTFFAQYNIINLDTLTSVPLVNSLGLPDPGVLQLVVWAPRGNGLAYVYRNNLFYRPTADENTEYAVTSTGVPGIVYHGIPDWVYEEEVLSSDRALWFSPDGRRLAYASFNDSRVRVMTVPFYGPPGNPQFQYPKSVNIRYPKPGTPNPTVSLDVINLDSLTLGTTTSLSLPPPDDLINSEPLLTAVTWADGNTVSAVWMNRVQNRARVLLCDAERASCRGVLSREESPGWVDIFTPPTFSRDGSRFALVLPHDVGRRGAFKHVTVVHPGGVTALTSGMFVVTEILAWDEQEGLVYFLATEEGDPSKLHLFSVSDDVRSAPNQVTCMSCRARDDCLYNKAMFSTNQSFFVLHCAGPDIPDVTLYSKKLETVLHWETNDELRGMLHEHALPKPFRLEVEVAGGFKAQVKLMLPPGMDTSGRTKYPLLVNVYGGPDSFQVTQRFGIDWSTYLTANRSFIYAAIDGRGSGLKGDRMLFAGYRKLGTVEIEDQISVTKYLQDNINYIDSDRTAIWGWSYGGYSTGMVLANDTEGVFQCGIAVAPVTDWTYYDTVYTERYMGLPTVDDNLEGYTRASLNAKVQNLRHKKFLLVHGTLDDNVHYQQSMMLSRVLEQADILFRQQTYPDEEHGLGGVRTHLYHTLENFLGDCLDLK